MKKFSSSAQMLSENLKKYLKRAGIAVVTTSLGIASVITVASDDSVVSSDAKMLAVAEADVSVIEDTKVEYSKIEYTDLQYSVSETEQMAKVEKTGQNAGAVALAKDEESDVKTVNAVLTTRTESTTEKVTTEATAEVTTTEKATEASNSESVQQTTTTETTTITVEVEDDSLESGTYLGTYTATAYCGCSQCCGKSDGVTASGTKATQGRTIAAPGTFPFGTELIINGHTYVVEDRGGSISGKRIDIYFDSHSDALAFGRQTVEVYVK